MAEGVLKPQLDALDAELVVLEEPFLAREERLDLDGLGSALDALPAGRSSRSGSRSATPRAPSTRALPTCRSTRSESTSTRRRSTTCPEGFDKLLLAGVLDARSSAPEEPREIAAFAGQLEERGVEDVALVPNGDLQYVSEAVAREKVARLGKAKTATTEAAA